MTASEAQTDEASIRYPGWRVVAVCFLVATFGWALGFYGQSVYLAELQRSRGWPASLVAMATTYFYLLGAVLVAFVAEAMRALGPKRFLFGGVLAMAAATVLLGQITAPWQLFAVNTLLALGWAGTSLGAVTNTLGLWFDRKRGMAISLALNGASFGGIAGVPLLVAGINAFGFAGATAAASGAALLILGPIIALGVGIPPARIGNVAALPVQGTAAIRAHAFRDRNFMTVSGAFAIVLLAQVGFIVHSIAYLEPLIGLEWASIAVSLLTVMAMVGRILFSFVIDGMNQRLVSALSFASQALAIAIIINVPTLPALLAACALFGFSVGNLITLPALIVQREFDPRAFGVLISLVTAINQVVYSFGPGIVGVLRDATGGYALPFYGCMALELIAAGLILIRRR